MQKLTRILSIAAVVLVAVPLLLLVITTPFQRVILELFNCPEEVLSYLPIFPWVTVLAIFLRLGCMIPLAITRGERGNILLEIILIAVMMLLLPGISELLTNLQTMLIGRLSGGASIAAHSYVNAYIVKFCTVSAGYGQVLAYVVCGMRIASKLFRRQAEKEPAE